MTDPDLRAVVEATVHATDLTPLQRVILLELHLQFRASGGLGEPRSASQVGEPIGLTPMTIHTNLRKLIGLGLVAMEKVPNFDRQQFETGYRLNVGV